ncbi:hypothetical protein [Emticicia agri]|uniref:Uncharacterized protein n=1 Tax=Emticicia agri TaxID=2492393 RepID=A0A4Q5M266_9BACT|nr:hypothetical protein [Emticicia agri]RYU96384.1 hypothetical protein EWM59_07690 [Emticicia agri]
MKKLIILLLIVLDRQIVFAQTYNYNSLDNKTIVSIVYKESSFLNTDPKTVVDENTNTTLVTNYPPGSNRFIVTSNLDFKTKDSPLVKFKVMRIQQKTSKFSIDTNVPFGSDEISKMAIEGYLPLIKKNINVKLNQKNNLTKDQIEIIELSQMDLPILNSQSVLSGILINKPDNTNSWTDSVKVKDGFYINTYTMVDEAKHQYKLNGYYKPNPKKESSLKKSTTDVTDLQPGQGIEAEVELLEMKYEASILLSGQYTGLIQSIDLNTYSSTNIKSIGIIENEQLKTKTRISNKISE